MLICSWGHIIMMRLMMLKLFIPVTAGVCKTVGWFNFLQFVCFKNENVRFNENLSAQIRWELQVFPINLQRVHVKS